MAFPRGGAPQSPIPAARKTVRKFFVMHSVGTEEVTAESAAAAVRKSPAPRGAREVFAVIDSAIIVRSEGAGHGAFCGFIGEPAKMESLP